MTVVCLLVITFLLHFLSSTVLIFMNGRPRREVERMVEVAGVLFAFGFMASVVAAVAAAEGAR